MSEQPYGEQRPMSQRLAAENAWKAMEVADAALIEGDHVEARAYTDNAKGWAAVASQFVFVMPTEPPVMHYWPAGGVDDRDFACDAEGGFRSSSRDAVTCRACLASPDGPDGQSWHGQPDDEHAVTIEDTLRINPMTETLSETVVLPRTVDPGVGKPLCNCPSALHAHVYAPEKGCR